MKKAPHLALSLKYRPQRFSEVVGQETVSTTLQNAVESRKLAHAYLFYGPRGIGKTTSARILAKALNCKDGPTPEPCGKCPACVEIASSTCVDVLELDAASNTGVDNVRDAIIQSASLAPSRDRYKVFIIDEAHMLSKAAFNALLKTIEEPPAHVVFILATTELAKILPTILSRCQRFRFRPPNRDAIAAYLQRIAEQEKIPIEPEARALLARAAGGALRDAVSLLEQAAAFTEGKLTRDKVAEMLGMLPEDMIHGAAKAVLERDAKALSSRLEKMAEEGFDPAQLLRDLRARFEELYLDRLGVRPAEEAAWKALAEGTAPEAFSFLIKRLNRILGDLQYSDTPQVTFELGLFGLLEAPYDLAQWVARLEALEKRLGGAPSAATPAAAPRPMPAREASAPAPAPKSVPPPAAKAPASDVWKDFHKRVQEAKPALATALDAARLASQAGGEWHIVFDNRFNLERAQKERAFLERQLSSAAGRAVSLKLEAAQSEPPKGEEEVWLDTASPDASVAPEARMVQDMFGGTIRQLKKK
ncbi:MAG TPA: hypothetical protein DCM05_03140 [Elusimicrobia bacterium]|nr:hypothetical protein [Elusimicrobiota bacterium]